MTRIHIFGASGSGTTTLGRMLAVRLACPHFDSDDFFWRPTDPPYREKRSIEERRALMEEMFLPRADWVLSGSIVGWSDGIAERFTLAVYLSLDPALRRARLEMRETVRRGQGAAYEPEVQAFLNWADRYESGESGRSRVGHAAWMAGLACPVLRLDSSSPPEALTDRVLRSIDGLPERV